MVDVDVQMPAAILHEVVSNRSGMPPEGFALYYQSKQLEGEAALASWGVQKDATIEVKTRGRGGAPKADGGADKAELKKAVEAATEEDPKFAKIMAQLKKMNEVKAPETNYSKITTDSVKGLTTIMNGVAVAKKKCAGGQPPAVQAEGVMSIMSITCTEAGGIIALLGGAEASGVLLLLGAVLGLVTGVLTLANEDNSGPSDQDILVGRLTAVIEFYDHVDVRRVIKKADVSSQRFEIEIINSPPVFEDLQEVLCRTKGYLAETFGKEIFGTYEGSAAAAFVAAAAFAAAAVASWHLSSFSESFFALAFALAAALCFVLACSFLAVVSGAINTKRLFDGLSTPLVETIAALEETVNAQSTDNHPETGVNGYHYIQAACPLFFRLHFGLSRLRCRPNFPPELRSVHDKIIENARASIRNMIEHLIGRPDPSKRGACSIFDGYAKASQEEIQQTIELASMCSEEGNDLAAKLAEHNIFTLQSPVTNSHVGLSQASDTWLSSEAGYSIPRSTVARAATFVAFSTTEGSALNVQVDLSLKVAAGGDVQVDLSLVVQDEVYLYCADTSKYMSMESSLGKYLYNGGYLRHYHWYAKADHSTYHKFHLKTAWRSLDHGPPEVEAATGHIWSDRPINWRSTHLKLRECYLSITSKKRGSNWVDETFGFYYDGTREASHRRSRMKSYTFSNQWVFLFKNNTITRMA